MKGIKYILAAVIVVLPLTQLMADEMTRDVSAAGVAIDLLLLITGLLCFFTCLKIFSLLRGGELSSGWQILSISFLLFSLAEILSISIKLEFIVLHQNAANVLHAFALMLIFFGVVKIKRSLT